MPHYQFIVPALLFTVSLTAHAEDWPRWRGPQANSISGESIGVKWPESGPPQLWTAEVGTGFSSCVIADGRLVTLGNRDEHDIVTCLDAVSGEKLWSHDYPEPVDPNLFEGGPTATPTIASEVVFTLSRRGHVCCLELVSGKVRWEKDLHAEFMPNIPAWGFSGSPLVTSAGLLLNVGSHGTLLSLADGATIWKSDNSDDAGYATPVLLGAKNPPVALVMAGKSINAVSLENGNVVWQFDWITRYGVNAADPHLLPDGIFLSSGYGKGATLLKLAGNDPPEALYRSRELRNQMSPGVLIDGYVYAPDGDAGTDPGFKCVEVATGKAVWTEEGLGSATLVATADRHLVILSDTGKLVIAKASSDQFESLASASVVDGKCWTMPSLAHGRLYCRNAQGRVICLDVRP